MSTREFGSKPGSKADRDWFDMKQRTDPYPHVITTSTQVRPQDLFPENVGPHRSWVPFRGTRRWAFREQHGVEHVRRLYPGEVR